ncbi:MAG: CCA tRNA nucleotidyltransferase [Bacillota bacterium]
MNSKINIGIPEEVIYIIDTLNMNNYKAYIVGGCVRDSIMGKEPKDWDVTTEAKMDEIKSLFGKTIDTGIKHGTVTVVLNKNNYEITTFRALSEDNPITIEGDMRLRDFTINAIAFHPKEGFIDPFKGLKDIENSVIRAVGRAQDRFTEDPLRMLRAVRFSSTLGFEIDKETLISIKHNSQLISTVSPERIRDELTKILVSARPMNFKLLRETGLLKHVLPEFDICFETTQNHPYHVYNVAEHSLHTVSSIENEKNLRWTMLLHDTGKAVTKTTDTDGIDHFYGHPEKSVQIAKKVLERLKFDNKTLNRVCTLIKHHDRRIEPNHRSVRKAVSVVGEDMFEDLLKVQEADKKGQNPQYLNDRLDALNRIRRIYYDIREKNQCLTLKDLAVDGSDLTNLGFEQGREIGIILNDLLEMVIDDPELNTKESLIKLINTRRK